MMSHKSTYQSGIALGPILFIIAILAILAAVIATGSGAFNANTNDENTKLLAQTIITQADQVTTAIQNVYLTNSCADNQINFNNAILDATKNYSNTSAPADHSCDVFDPRGGAITYSPPPSTALDVAAYNSKLVATNFVFGQYYFTSQCVMGIGGGGYGYTSTTNPCVYAGQTTGSSLVLMLPWVSVSVCLMINQLVGFHNVNSTTPESNGNFSLPNSPFLGTYGGGGIVTDGTYGGPSNLGAMQGCLQLNSQLGPGYYYFRVLLPRPTS